MNIFEPRKTLRPYEYPELEEYVDAIRHSYWLHTEFNYTSDIDDFHSNVTDHEREIISRSMVAIAQVEVAVKTFWGDLYKHMPKPEIGAVGATFAESEVRHMDAYAHLLDLLGLNEQFDKAMREGALQDRVNYLSEVLEYKNKPDNKEYAKSILLFTLLTENVSLFSQFLIMMTFNKEKNIFKGISNAIEATSKEEQIHALFGMDLINTISRENPEWFDDTFKEEMRLMCQKAVDAEIGVLDWIYGGQDWDVLPRDVVCAFIKNRMNRSLIGVGLKPLYSPIEEMLEQTDWFDNEVLATKQVDFFSKRSVNYNKRSSSVTSDDLF